MVTYHINFYCAIHYNTGIHINRNCINFKRLVLTDSHNFFMRIKCHFTIILSGHNGFKAVSMFSYLEHAPVAELSIQVS